MDDAERDEDGCISDAQIDRDIEQLRRQRIASNGHVPQTWLKAFSIPTAPDARRPELTIESFAA